MVTLLKLFVKFLYGTYLASASVNFQMFSPTTLFVTTGTLLSPGKQNLKSRYT